MRGESSGDRVPIGFNYLFVGLDPQEVTVNEAQILRELRATDSLDSGFPVVLERGSEVALTAAQLGKWVFPAHGEL